MTKLAFLVSYSMETIRTSLVKERLVTEAIISIVVLAILIAIL